LPERVFTLSRPNRGGTPSVIQLRRRRFFPERRYRQPLRWLIWVALALIFLVFVLFMKLFK